MKRRDWMNGGKPDPIQTPEENKITPKKKPNPIRRLSHGGRLGYDYSMSVDGSDYNAQLGNVRAFSSTSQTGPSAVNITATSTTSHLSMGSTSGIDMAGNVTIDGNLTVNGSVNYIPDSTIASYQATRTHPRPEPSETRRTWYQDNKGLLIYIGVAIFIFTFLWYKFNDTLS